MQVETIKPPVIQVEPVVSYPLRRVTSWNVFKATVIKDLIISVRYKENLIGKFIELAIRIGFFFLLSQAISLAGDESLLGRQMTSRDLFIFFQGALILFVFKGTALKTPLKSVGSDLYNGTLEFIYSNPSPRYAYYMGTIVSDVLISQVIFLPIFALLIFYSRAGVGNMLMVLLVCLVVFITLVAMGVMIGLLGLLWRQVGSIAGIIEIAFEMLAGAYFPVTEFPIVFQYLAYLLPFTWGYDLVRYYSFNQEWTTLLPVWQEWSILAVFAVIYTILSRHFLVKVEKLAKVKGLHLI